MKNYETFQFIIMALISAKVNQAEFIKRRAPICVIEHANEQVAKIRGQAIKRAKEDDQGVPSLDSLKAGMVIGLSSIVAGYPIEGNEIILIAKTVRDVIYQGESLDTEESLALLNSLKQNTESPC